MLSNTVFFLCASRLLRFFLHSSLPETLQHTLLFLFPAYVAYYYCLLTVNWVHSQPLHCNRTTNILSAIQIVDKLFLKLQQLPNNLDWIEIVL